MNSEPVLEPGWISDELAAEFPKLGVRFVRVKPAGQRTPAGVKARLKEMSNRFTGGKAVNLRQEPIPWAYRVFFRQVGIDPDEQRTPVEGAALERMRAGAFVSSGLLADALLVATVETGVALLAFEAAAIEEPVGLRLSEPDEYLGGPGGRPLSVRQIVIADAERSLAVLFGDAAEGVLAAPRSEEVLLVAIQVKGVPEIALEEALWTAAEVLGSA